MWCCCSPAPAPDSPASSSTDCGSARARLRDGLGLYASVSTFANADALSFLDPSSALNTDRTAAVRAPSEGRVSVSARLCTDVVGRSGGP